MLPVRLSSFKMPNANAKCQCNPNARLKEDRQDSRKRKKEDRQIQQQDLEHFTSTRYNKQS